MNVSFKHIASLNLQRVWLLPLIFCSVALSAQKVSFEVDTLSMRIGEQIQYKIYVEADTTALVHFPEGQTFSPLETVEASKTDTLEKEKGKWQLIKSYALTQFDSGQYFIPPQRIEVNGKPLFTDTVRIAVGDVAVDTTKQKMYDIKPLMSVEKDRSGLWIGLAIVLGVLGILGALYYWFFYRKQPTEQEKEAMLPPYERALLELDRLEKSRYLIQDEFKAYYSELTGIVRGYLEEEVHVSALESTTDELIHKLELLRDSGQLDLDDETLGQFQRILQTADLVKFAKSKPSVNRAEDDRKQVKAIVERTKEAIPELSEEELMEQEAYREALLRKRNQKRIVRLAGFAAFLIAGGITYSIITYGFTNVKDTVLGHPTKSLLEQEWVNSAYGFPPILLESPEVLIRQEVELPAEVEESIEEVQVFAYADKKANVTIAATSTLFADPQQELEFGKAAEQIIQNFEKQGVKNIITKEEEFLTASGIPGLKVYGSGEFKIGKSSDYIRGEYTILLFGGRGYQQQLVLTWEREDDYAQQIIDRILKTIEVRNEV